MSENLSIDEIIKKAEEIKREAEKQLQAAEKSLDEKAKTAMDEVVVDEKQVVDRIARVYEKIEEEDEDIKEYVPPTKREKRSLAKTQRFGGDDDIRVAAPVSDKTRTISSLDDDGDIKIADKSESAADGATRRIIVSNTESETENELQEVPTIYAKEHMYAGFDGDSGDEENIEEELGVQMTFDGFDDAVESVPTIDEEVAEQILYERRQEKVGKFRLFGPDETDQDLGSDKVVKEDYNSRNEKERFLEKLKAKKNSIKLKMIATLWLAVPMVLLTVFKDSAYFPSLLSSHSAYFIAACIIYGLVLLVNSNVIIHGFNLKRRLNSDFPISIVALLILAHTIVVTANKSLWIDNGVLLVLSGTFSMFMSQLGKSRMMSRIIDNFCFISDTEDKYTVENIANTVDADIICRGLLEGEPRIKTSVKTDLPSNFMEISTKREAANKIAKIVFPVSLLLAAALLVAIGIINNFNTGFNMALCSLAITLPCCSLYLCNTMLLDISRGLRDYGSRVCGFEGAEMACGANAIVMEASDLFGANSCEMHGFKAFDTKVDDAIIYTAAIMTQTKSPLARVFDKVIIGKQSILPVVEDITYENKMGVSAWIYKRKVLVGNRDLLTRHGVDVPTKSFEKKYTIKGRKALYLAIDGTVAAMFVVSYSADPALKRELRKLERSGITIIVKSSDPYINEQSISKLFSLPEGFVRVMNYSAARVYDKYSSMHVEKSPAYIVHDGTAIGFVSAMRSAEIIRSSGRLITFLSCFGSAIGFATVALLSVLESFSSITAVNIIVFQVIWNAFILLLNKLKGLAL